MPPENMNQSDQSNVNPLEQKQLKLEPQVLNTDSIIVIKNEDLKLTIAAPVMGF